MAVKSEDRKIAKFIKSVAKSKREEQVLDAYAALLGVDEWPRPFGSDGLACDTLFEGKLDKVMDSEEGNKALAQSCYYMRNIQRVGVYKGDNYQVPLRVAVVDKNEAFVVGSAKLEKYFGQKNTYDWDRPASNPDPKLVADLAEVERFIHNTDTPEGVKGFLAALEAQGKPIAQHVTRDNFRAIFDVWKTKFADKLNPQEAAKAFILDLQKDVSEREDKGLLLFGTEGSILKVRADVDAHRAFWRNYALPPSQDELVAILKRKDWLVVMQARRSGGEFFTPTDLAQLARERILQVIPDAYEKWNWWDMCCGTGNLEVDMPGMPGRLFMSTINGEDVDMIKGQGMADILGANVFKYDFLNQTDEELPKELLEKLTPGSKWVFFLNPPFVRGIGGSIISSEEETRSGMGNTAIGDTMGQEVGGARQNLITQFLWRIKSLTVAKKIDAVVAVFSTAIWMTGQNYDLFRNTWGNTFDHKAGFCFGSWEFEGAAGKWPVAMSIWRSKDV